MSIPFMNTVGANVASTTNMSQKPLVLNEGQMIHGKIQQLYPGQLAEVQVGSHKMLAKLEVPMKAGDSYYFQVSAVNPEVQLKIISGPTSAQLDSTQQLQNLMQAMQLPKSPEMTQLLSFIIDNKIPITREGILQAVQFLQMTPKESQSHALVAIQKMLDLKLPMNVNIFQAILGVESKEGLHPVLQTLKSTLQNDSSITSQVREPILSLLNQMERPLATSTSLTLLGESLRTLLNNEESPATRFSILQLLKESGIVPTQTSLPNLQKTLTAVVTERIGLPQTGQVNLTAPQISNLTQFISELSFLTGSQKEALVNLARNEGIPTFVNSLTQMLGENLPRQSLQLTNSSTQQILSLLNHGNTQDAPEKLMALLQNAERTTNEAIRQTLQLAESAVSNAIDGKVMKETMQTIFRSLGMNYEAGILGKEAQSERFMQMLKPQLLTMLNDPSVSANVKDIAEQFVVRMNGSPLMSTESGLNHQLIMQLPLEFFGKKIDATLQWNGRMKDDKKIDADFARILFYLNLHSLEETVVDMQVQNRVVTVTVFNEDETLQTIGHPLQERLKDGLYSIGYQLSGVFFKGFVEENTKPVAIKKENVFEGGMDFRI